MLESSEASAYQWQLAMLNDYPAIQRQIAENMGSLKLKQYLLNLLSDSYQDDKPRQGFPPAVAEALMLISLENIKQIEAFS